MGLYSSAMMAAGVLQFLLSNLSPVVSLTGALLALSSAYAAYRLNRRLSDRTLTVEAQKLLLEINKQYLGDPDLFAVYLDWPGREEILQNRPELPQKLKALAYLKLNVFEIVFAVLPRGTSKGPWVAYFEDSLTRCPVLSEELDRAPGIYHPELIRAYGVWKEKARLVTLRSRAVAGR